MADNKVDLFSKGEFKDINNDFIEEGTKALEAVSIVQDKYGKLDTDTFINELRDSIIGGLLGFDMVNENKHGFDCRDKESKKFLEVKNASFSADNWVATFNDTTYEKADAFKDERVFLALGVWNKAAELLFVVYGKNDELGKYLRQKVEDFKGSTKLVRSTQSVSYFSLVRNYGFDIIVTDSKTKEEIYQIIIKKTPTMKSDITVDNLKNFSDFKEESDEGL